MCMCACVHVCMCVYVNVHEMKKHTKNKFPKVTKEHTLPTQHTHRGEVHELLALLLRDESVHNHPLGSLEVCRRLYDNRLKV